MSAPRFPSFGVWAVPLCLLLGGSGPAPGQPDEPPPRAAAPDREDFQVYRLHFASAVDTAQTLNELFNGKSERPARARILADPQTNSLLVAATAMDRATIEKLLQKLDVEGAKTSAGPQLAVFVLKHREPDPALEAALRLVLGDPRAGRFAIDPQRRQVLVYANRDTLDTVEALLTRLDDAAAQARPPAPPAELEVRLSWVVSGSTPGEAVKGLDEFKEAGAELGRAGIDRPRLAAELAVSATPEVRATNKPAAQFEMTGVATLDKPYRLAVTGTVLDGKETADLDIGITVSRAGGQDTSQVGRLHTQVSVPLDRPLVLGAAPADGLKLAFVVRVQRRKAAEAPARSGKSFGMEFRAAPWSRVFEWLGDQSGLPVIGSLRATGTFTFVPPRPDSTFSLAEVIDILNDALLRQNDLLVRREHSFIEVAADGKVDPAWVPRVTPEDLEQRGRTELVSVIVPLKSLAADEVAPEVKNLLGPFGEVVVLKSGNRLVVQDLAGNVRSVIKLLEDLDMDKTK